jgi:hypothetical protein
MPRDNTGDPFRPLSVETGDGLGSGAARWCGCATPKPRQLDQRKRQQTGSHRTHHRRRRPVKNQRNAILTHVELAR